MQVYHPSLLNRWTSKRWSVDEDLVDDELLNRETLFQSLPIIVLNGDDQVMFIMSVPSISHVNLALVLWRVVMFIGAVNIWKSTAKMHGYSNSYNHLNQGSVLNQNV